MTVLSTPPAKITAFLRTTSYEAWAVYAIVAFLFVLGGWISQAWRDDHEWKCLYFGGSWPFFGAWIASHAAHFG